MVDTELRTKLEALGLQLKDAKKNYSGAKKTAMSCERIVDAGIGGVDTEQAELKVTQTKEAMDAVKDQMKVLRKDFYQTYKDMADEAWAEATGQTKKSKKTKEEEAPTE